MFLRAAVVRCWRGETSPAQSDPILLFSPVFMFASVFSRYWPWTLLQQCPNPSLRKPCREEAPSSCRSNLLGTRSSSLPAWSPTGLQPERSPLFHLPHVHLPPEISFCMSPLLAMLHAGHLPLGTSVVLASCYHPRASQAHASILTIASTHADACLRANLHMSGAQLPTVYMWVY